MRARGAGRGSGHSLPGDPAPRLRLLPARAFAAAPRACVAISQRGALVRKCLILLKCRYNGIFVRYLHPTHAVALANAEFAFASAAPRRIIQINSIHLRPSELRATVARVPNRSDRLARTRVLLTGDEWRICRFWQVCRSWRYSLARVRVYWCAKAASRASGCYDAGKYSYQLGAYTQVQVCSED